MKWYICLLRGIHDVPGNRRVGEIVVGESREVALGYAAERCGLASVPPFSTAVPMATPQVPA